MALNNFVSNHSDFPLRNYDSWSLGAIPREFLKELCLTLLPCSLLNLDEYIETILQSVANGGGGKKFCR